MAHIMLPVCTRRDPYISKSVNVSAHMLECILYTSTDVEFLRTSIATVREVVIMYLLIKRQKWRQWSQNEFC